MPQQERAIATRRRALHGAATVIDRLGYEAATVAQIVQESGLTKGALYFHFPSKEAIAEAIIAEQGAWLARQIGPGTPGVQSIVDVSYAFVEALRTDPLMRASIRMTIDRATSPDMTVAGYQAWIDGVAAVLTRARADGVLAEGLDPGAAAYVVCGAMTGLQLTSNALCGRADLQDRVEDFWRLAAPSLVRPEHLADLELRPPERRGDPA